MLKTKEKIDIEKITGLWDTMFKGIMYKRKRVLSGLLDTGFQRNIGKFKYLHTELSVRKFIEKGRRLDLYLEETDSYIDIEVTNNYGVYIINRNMSFEFKMYCDTVTKGDEYELYKSVSALQLIGGKKDEENRRDYYLRDKKGKVLSKELLYSEICVDNYVEMYYNKDEKAIKKYKYIIMLGLNLKELRKFNQEYGDDIVNEYTEAFEEMIIQEFEPLFDKEEDERRIRKTLEARAIKQGLEKGEKKGLKRGIAQGIEQGEKNKQIDIAKKMLKRNLEVDDIVDITGLTKEEVNNLK